MARVVAEELRKGTWAMRDVDLIHGHGAASLGAPGTGLCTPPFVRSNVPVFPYSTEPLPGPPAPEPPSAADPPTVPIPLPNPRPLVDPPTAPTGPTTRSGPQVPAGPIVLPAGVALPKPQTVSQAPTSGTGFPALNSLGLPTVFTPRNTSTPAREGQSWSVYGR
jgi:hypothetical protein